MKISKHILFGLVIGVVSTLIIISIYNKVNDSSDVYGVSQDITRIEIKEIAPGPAPDSPDNTIFYGPWKSTESIANMKIKNAYVHCNPSGVDICILTFTGFNKEDGREFSDSDKNKPVVVNSFTMVYAITEEYEKAGKIVSEFSNDAIGKSSKRLIIDYNLGTVELFNILDEESLENISPLKIGEMVLEPSQHIYPFK